MKTKTWPPKAKSAKELLPSGCNRCRNNGGFPAYRPFVLADNGVSFERCDCSRGIALQQRDRARRERA